jgi:hypothetical protein
LPGLGELFKLRFIDPALAPGDFLRAGDFQALALFDGGDELAGFEQADSCVPVSSQA